MLRPLVPLALVPTAALLALPAATAAGPPAAHDSRSHTVRLSTVPGRFAFAPARLRTSAGAITLRLRNVAGVPHGIAIAGRSGAVVAPGGTSTVTARLKRGTYTFFCPVAGHRALGMKGTLTVR